jgi:hypothetical protein
LAEFVIEEAGEPDVEVEDQVFQGYSLAGDAGQCFWRMPLELPQEEVSLPGSVDPLFAEG